MLRRTLLILTLILTATAFTQTARAGVTVQSGITKVLDPNGGEHVSMVLDSSGSPVIAYYDPVDSDLEFIHCGDPLCNTMTTRTLASAGLVGMYASIQLDSSDRPRIAYQDSTNNAVKIAICADPTCASVSLVTLDSGDIFAGRFADLALTAADHPVVVHATTTAITVAVCGDPVCSSVANHIAVPKTGGLELTETSLALTSQDWPVIAFFQEDNSANNNEDVKLAVCFNPICGSVTVTDIDLTGFHAGHTELVLTNEDLARLTYVQQSGDDDVRAVYCNDLICSNPEITAFEAASSSAYASIALDSEDNLAAAYYTGTLQIRLVTCAEEPPCERRTVDAGLSTPAPPVPVALALDAANNAVIVYEMDGQLRLYREVDTLGNADFELGFSPWTLIASGGGDGRICLPDGCGVLLVANGTTELIRQATAPLNGMPGEPWSWSFTVSGTDIPSGGQIGARLELLSGGSTVQQANCLVSERGTFEPVRIDCARVFPSVPYDAVRINIGWQGIGSGVLMIDDVALVGG